MAETSALDSLRGLRDFCSHPQGKPEEIAAGFKHAFYGFCSAFVRSADVAVDSIKESLKAASFERIPDASGLAADVLWIFNLQFSDASCPERKRYAELIRLISECGGLNEKLAERLDAELLTGAGVVEARFSKLLMKFSSQKHFSQVKYNLFREANEGYAKLLTELIELRTNWRLRVPSAEAVVLKIHALIGYFKLDPFRVQALVLDAYEQDITNAFYLEVLKTFQNSNCATLLGFQFRYLFSKPVDASGEKSVDAQQSLLLLAATLIKHGIMTIADIYPFLGPSDAEAKTHIGNYNDARVTEAVKVGQINLAAVASSTTAAAAPLPAAGTMGNIHYATFTSEVPVPPVLCETTNQKLGLVVNLLKAEAFDAALELLNVLESLDPAQCPAVCDEMCVQLTHIVDPVYAKLSYRLIMEGKENRLPGPTPDQLKQLEQFGFPLLLHLGIHVYGSVELFSKVCRVLKLLLSPEYREPLAIESWLEKLVPLVLFPALAVLPPNPCLCYELWEILKCINYEKRFYVYGTFLASYAAPNFRLVLMKNLSSRETSSICKRIAKDSTRTYGRSLAKIAHANPLIAFDKIIEQAMAYENLISCMVEMIRYVTPLAMDILVFQLLAHMSTPTKTRVRDDATYSAWLANLGTFAGNFYRKYHSLADLTPLLTYLVKRLREGQISDLVVIRELMLHMTGNENMETTCNDVQLQAHAGGPTLRFISGGPAESLTGVNMRILGKASKRLRDKLVTGGLAQPLLLLLAQLLATHLLTLPADTPENAFQMVVEEYDQITNIFNVMVNFLTTSHPKEPKELVRPTTIPLTPTAAATTASVSNASASSAATPLSPSVPALSSVAPGESRPASPLPSPLAGPTSNRTHTASPTPMSPTFKTGKEASETDALSDDAQDDEFGIGFPRMAALVQKYGIQPEVAFTLVRRTIKDRPVYKLEDAKEILGDLTGTVPRSPEYWAVVNAGNFPQELYYLFWTMDLYDIYIPLDRYNDTMQRLKSQISDGENKTRYNPDPHTGKSVQTAGLKDDLQSIQTELNEQMANLQAVQKRLTAFAAVEYPTRSHERFMSVFIQECLYPRMTLSVLDAIFCAEFIKLVHREQWPSINLLVLSHQIFSQVTNWLACVSEAEAQRIGRFMRYIIEMLMKWRLSEGLYNKECFTHPGFRDRPSAKGSGIPFSTFKTVHSRLHDKLVRGFARCLQSPEVFERRNCLLVLEQIKDVFPQHKKFGSILLKKIETMREQEGLRTLAERCHAILSNKKYLPEIDGEDEKLEMELKKPKPAAAPAPSATQSTATTTVKKEEKKTEVKSSTSTAASTLKSSAPTAAVKRERPAAETKDKDTAESAAKKVKDEKTEAAPPKASSTSSTAAPATKTDKSATTASSSSTSRPAATAAAATSSESGKASPSGAPAPTSTGASTTTTAATTTSSDKKKEALAQLLKEREKAGWRGAKKDPASTASSTAKPAASPKPTSSTTASAATGSKTGSDTKATGGAEATKLAEKRKAEGGDADSTKRVKVSPARHGDGGSSSSGGGIHRS